MSAAVQPGRIYRIKNKHTGQYLSPHQWSVTGRRNLESIMWCGEDSGSQHFKRQAWHVFALDGGKFMIVNAVGGEVLAPYVNSNDTFVCESYSWRDNINYLNQQSWLIRPTGMNDNSFHIINHLTGWAMSPERFAKGPCEGTRNWMRVVQWNNWVRESPICQWFFEDAGTVPYVEPYRSSDNVLRPTPEMKDRNDPGNTKPVLMARSVVPFLLIDEYGGDQWKTQGSHFYLRAGSTPYYLIERYAYWKRFNYKAYSSPIELKMKTELTYGVITNNATQVETTTGLELKLDLGFRFWAFSVSINSTLQHQLHVTTSSSTATETWKKETIEITYPAGQDFAGTAWVRADKYYVKRIEAFGDPVEIISWEAVNKDIRAISSYPKQSTQILDDAPERSVAPSTADG